MHGSKADKSVCVGVITGINLGIGLAYAQTLPSVDVAKIVWMQPLPA